MGTDGKSNSFSLGLIPAIYSNIFKHTSTKSKVFSSEGPVDCPSLIPLCWLHLPFLSICISFCLYKQSIFHILCQVGLSTLSKLKSTNQSHFSFFSLRKLSSTNVCQYIKIDIININQIHKNQ